MSYDKTSIVSALTRIHNHEWVLPDIQRDFVWEPERIYKLLDSILRGYPFGTLLFWNTRQHLQYREFIRDWHKDEAYTFQVKLEGQKTTVVLDGQQRLQSLYIATDGSFETRVLYFDVLSGKANGDVSELMYDFEFMDAGKAEQRNQARRGSEFWVPFKEVAAIPEPELVTPKARAYATQAGAASGSEEEMRLDRNLSNVVWKMRVAEGLNYYTVDKEFGDDGRKTNLDEVLEIFVRVNSGGEVLSKSDLMFSLMQLHWPKAAGKISDLREDLNGRGLFDFDKDFILKCALVCCGKGARYDVGKLRTQETVKAIEESFDAVSSALISCVDFVVNTARFSDGRVLGSYNSLIPFVYFIYKQPKQQIKDESTLLAMKQALYLILMTHSFSRYADNRIDSLGREVLDPEHIKSPGVFPIAGIRRFVRDHDGTETFDDRLLQNNIPLLMNILENGAKLPEGKRYHRPEYDHILPQSRLRELGYSEEQINDYANLRLISKYINIWKSNQDPKAYFAAQPDVMKQYLIPPEWLDYKQFPQFLAARRTMIWERVHSFLGLEEVKPIVESVTPVLPSQPTIATQVGDTPQPEAVSDVEIIRRVLTRHPVPDAHRWLFGALYAAADNGLLSSDICAGLGYSHAQMRGSMGALGRRINETPGVKNAPHTGTGLLFDCRWEGNEWSYTLRPEFRDLLRDDAEIARLALPDKEA